MQAGMLLQLEGQLGRMYTATSQPVPVPAGFTVSW